jgi:hypothetical protein
MPNIPPPPDNFDPGEVWSAESEPPPGPSVKAEARRKRLGTVPAKPRVVLQVDPNMVVVDPGADAAAVAAAAEAGLTAAERAAGWVRRAKERSAAERARKDAEAALTDEQRAERRAADEERRDRAERAEQAEQAEQTEQAERREQAEQAEQAADVAPVPNQDAGDVGAEEARVVDRDANASEAEPEAVPEAEPEAEPRATDAGINPRLRRYLRVQDFLDEAVLDTGEERKRIAHRLRVVEKGRREALATEYAYPLATTDTSGGVEDDKPRRVSDDPESVDAVPVKWSTSSVADRSYTAMVATTLTISHQAAQTMVHTSAGLHKYFERTLTLLEQGRTSYRHAQAVVEFGWSVPEESLPEYEDIVLRFAETMTPPQFERKAKAVADTYRDDPLEERHKEAVQRRELTITPADDGMADLNLHMDAAGAYGIYHRVSKIAWGIHTKDDERTPKQTKADVAAEILLTGTTEVAGTPTMDGLNLRAAEHHGVVFRDTPEDLTAHIPGIMFGENGWELTPANADRLWRTGTLANQPHDLPEGLGVDLGVGNGGTGLGAGILAKVALHVPALTLLEHGTEPAYLEQYGPISIETALLLMGTAPGFTRILTDPDSGATLSVGTKQYKVPDGMRQWILYRDKTCRFPGCSMPAKWCDLDHSLDWAHGGETKVTNLIALCRKHHVLKHNTGWNYSTDDDAVVTWVSPSGRQHPTAPANHIPVTTHGGTVHADVGTKREHHNDIDLTSTHDERITDLDMHNIQDIA